MSFVLIAAGTLLVFMMFLRARDAAWLRFEFAPMSIWLIGALGTLGLLGVLTWWFVPMGRRPHRIPMWNDLHHRPGPRAVTAATSAAAAGALMALLGLVVVSSLLPGMNSPATSVVPGGVVVDVSSGTWRCRGRLTLWDGGGRRYVCACPFGDCIRGFSRSIQRGHRIGLEISENWAGATIVGLVQHGA
jgi:hypothetical protein